MTTNTAVKIDRESFTRAMEEIVKGNEDYVYEKPSIPSEHALYDPEWGEDPVSACFYRDPNTNQPSCLIGRVLDKLGVEYQEQWENKPAFVVLDLLVGARYTEDIGLEEAASRAQQYQDLGHTWGRALEEYHKVLNGDPLGWVSFPDKDEVYA